MKCYLANTESDQRRSEQNPGRYESLREKRKNCYRKLAHGELEDQIVTVEVEEQAPSMFDMLQGQVWNKWDEYAGCI